LWADCEICLGWRASRAPELGRAGPGRQASNLDDDSALNLIRRADVVGDGRQLRGSSPRLPNDRSANRLAGLCAPRSTTQMSADLGKRALDITSAPAQAISELAPPISFNSFQVQ